MIKIIRSCLIYLALQIEFSSSGLAKFLFFAGLFSLVSHFLNFLILHFTYVPPLDSCSIHIMIAAPQGGFIVTLVWEIVGRKNLTIFKGCHHSRFFIMISSSYSKIETHRLIVNSDPGILTSLVLGTTSLATHWLFKH